MFYLCLYLCESLPLSDQRGLLSFQGFVFRDGARGQYLGHHIFIYILKTWWWMNIILERHKHWPETICVGQWPIFHGPIFHGPAILPYILKTIWWLNVILEILVQCDTNIDLKPYMRQWPIFHGPVILPYSLKTIWWTNVTNGILVPCDAKIYLIKCMWVSDLCFMVQWFCLISLRLFDGQMS